MIQLVYIVKPLVGYRQNPMVTSLSDRR